MSFFPTGLFNNLSEYFPFLKRKSDRYAYGSSVLQGSTRFNRYSDELEKVNCVLSNPAVLKVFALQCDMFSRAKASVLDLKTGKPIENDPFLKRLRNPNPFQTQSQFLWDFMFFTMLGNSYGYVDSKLVENDKNKMYFMIPFRIKWPQNFEYKADKLYLSDAAIKTLSDTPLKYKYNDNSTFEFRLGNLVCNADLTNGLGNWFKGPSRIDALYKIISNSEHALDSKNINVRYAGKFMVGSQSDIGKTPMSDEEKADIEDKVDNSDQRVWAVRSQINIRRFVENLSQQELGKAFLEDYFLIGMMYGIPRDVLEAYNSSTFENQEKARGAHVAYCLEPKGEAFMDAFEKFFGYTDKNIVLSWDHLAFTQVFEGQRQEVKAKQVKTFSEMRKAGITVEQANEFLGTKFEIDEQATAAAAPQGAAAASGQGQAGQGSGEENPSTQAE
jgi:hypothetical protein